VTSEISALSFNTTETTIVSGTSRGSISIWDINSQKCEKIFFGLQTE